VSRLKIDGEIQNVSATLRALKQIDPELRKRVPDEIKSYAQPMLAEIKAGLPTGPPIPGWSKKGRTGYRPSSARYKVQLQFRGSRPKNSPVDSWPVLRVRSRHLAAIIYDTAGRRSRGRTEQGRAMIAKLTKEHGRASRSVWPIVEKHVDDIERGIEESFANYAKIISKELA
jgi:hypothetical protein